MIWHLSRMESSEKSLAKAQQSELYCWQQTVNFSRRSNRILRWNKKRVWNVRKVQGRRSRERGGGVGPCPPTFWANSWKKEDYHFTVENTELTGTLSTKNVECRGREPEMTVTHTPLVAMGYYAVTRKALRRRRRSGWLYVFGKRKKKITSKSPQKVQFQGKTWKSSCFIIRYYNVAFFIVWSKKRKCYITRFYVQTTGCSVSKLKKAMASCSEESKSQR